MQHLLLLHGAIGAKDQLIPLSEKLKSDFCIHTLNFSGHGGEKMPEKFEIQLFANDVLNYMTKNNIDKINIFGYSMGGYVALYLALHYPEKILKVFTLATKFLWTTEIAEKEIKMLNAAKIEEKIPDFAHILKKRHQPNDWKDVLKKTADMMIALGNNNTLKASDYKGIQHSVCVCIGEKDKMVTKEETIEVVSNLLNRNYIILPEIEHPIEKMNIELLVNELHTFLLY
jgi:esterase/lipase